MDWLEKARRYYDKEGGWTKEQLQNLVAKGKLTAEDFAELTGEEYEALPLSETTEAVLDTALNVEYMVCLMEESLGLE